MQIGSQAGNLGRNVALSSKLALEVPGTTVDRQCGSSLQAIQFGAQAVMSGTQDVVICGGVEAMSTVEIGSNVRDGLEKGRGVPKGERLELQYPGIQFSQFDGAELLAEKYQISREALDEFGLLSHQRAAAATRSGYFEQEIVPLNIELEDGSKDVHTVDEGIRFEANLEGMQSLNALREGGVITAGTASQISDGAAAIMVANEEAVGSLTFRCAPRFILWLLSVLTLSSCLKAPFQRQKRCLKKRGSASTISIYTKSTKPSALCRWHGQKRSMLTRTN